MIVLSSMMVFNSSAPDQIFAFSREKGGDAVVCMFNFSNRTGSVKIDDELPEGDYLDLFSGSRTDLSTLPSELAPSLASMRNQYISPAVGVGEAFQLHGDVVPQPHRLTLGEKFPPTALGSSAESPPMMNVSAASVQVASSNSN